MTSKITLPYRGLPSTSLIKQENEKDKRANRPSFEYNTLNLEEVFPYHHHHQDLGSQPYSEA